MTTPTDDNVIYLDNPDDGHYLHLPEPDPRTLTFTNPDGTPIGEVSYSPSKRAWKFQGDCDASAETFIRYLMDTLGQREKER